MLFTTLTVKENLIYIWDDRSDFYIFFRFVYYKENAFVILGKNEKWTMQVIIHLKC